MQIALACCFRSILIYSQWREAQLLSPSDAQSVTGEHSGTCGCPAEAGSIASHNHTV